MKKDTRGQVSVFFALIIGTSMIFGLILHAIIQPETLTLAQTLLLTTIGTPLIIILGFLPATDPPKNTTSTNHHNDKIFKKDSDNNNNVSKTNKSISNITKTNSPTQTTHTQRQ